VGSYDTYVELEKKYQQDYQNFIVNKNKSLWYALPSDLVPGTEYLSSTICPTAAGHKMASDAIMVKIRANTLRNRTRKDYFALAYIQSKSREIQVDNHNKMVTEFTKE
jgi:hypothetical protein